MQRVAVIRIAVQRLRPDNEPLLAGGHQTDFTAELVFLMRLALADAFDLGRVQRADFPAALVLALIAHPPGERESLGEQALQLRIARAEVFEHDQRVGGRGVDDLDALAGRRFASTSALAAAIRAALPRLAGDDRDLCLRRVFQALRIAVNDEFSALETFLRHLPACLNPGGRAAVLTFHSGEDRRVKKAFAAGLREGIYAEIAQEVIRPTSDERHANPRSAPAKLRWARKANDRG